MPSARLTASYQTIETASNTTVTDIKDDMMALQQAVANYGIDPVEILHMGKLFHC
jgi:carotenoid cleavage dioxygenase-like enzyme